MGRPRGVVETAAVESGAREGGCTAAFAAGAGVGSSRSTRPLGVRGRNPCAAVPPKARPGFAAGVGQKLRVLDDGAGVGTSLVYPFRCVLVSHWSCAAHSSSPGGQGVIGRRDFTDEDLTSVPILALEQVP